MKCKACEQELDNQTQLSEIPCGHIFHEECLMKQYYNPNSNNICPQCPQKFFLYHIGFEPSKTIFEDMKAKYIFITTVEASIHDFCSASECEFQCLTKTLHVKKTDITDPNLLSELQNMKIGSDMIHKWTNTYLEVIIVNDHGEFLPIVHHLTKFLPKPIYSGTGGPTLSEECIKHDCRCPIQKIYRLQ